MGKNNTLSKDQAKELRGNLREVFTKHSTEEVFKKLPRHIQLKNRKGELVNTRDPEELFTGIHEHMLKRDFDAIAKLINKFTPKEQSPNAKKKARYSAEAAAGKAKSSQNDGLS